MAALCQMAGSFKLLRNQAPVPGENGIRLGHLRDVFQRLASKPFGNLGQRDSLRTGKPQPHRQMASQNPILCDQVLVVEQQILIHQPRYERQEACPVELIAHGGTFHHNASRPGIIRTSMLTKWENGIDTTQQRREWADDGGHDHSPIPLRPLPPPSAGRPPPP